MPNSFTTNTLKEKRRAVTKLLSNIRTRALSLGNHVVAECLRPMGMTQNSHRAAALAERTAYCPVEYRIVKRRYSEVPEPFAVYAHNPDRALY